MDYQEDDTQFDEDDFEENFNDGNESSYYSSEGTHTKPTFSPVMYILLGLSCVIAVGYITLKLYGGGYHYWVYGLLVLLLVVANILRLHGLRRLRVRSFVGACVVFLLLASIISFSANSERILSNWWYGFPTTTYEYYDDNIIWHGSVYKKFVIGGIVGLRVYTYDRQGNLISESDRDWDTPFFD